MAEGTLSPEQTVAAYVAAMREQALKFKAMADAGKISGLAQMTLLMQEASMVAEEYWLYPERCFAGGSVGWGHGADVAPEVEPTFITRSLADTTAEVEVAVMVNGERVAGDAYRLQFQSGRWWIEGQLARK